jgi:hypothetical protein
VLAARRQDGQPVDRARGLPDLPTRPIREADEFPRPDGQRPPTRGQRDAGRRPHEQRVAEIGAQRGDGHRDRRFTDAECRGGSSQ